LTKQNLSMKHDEQSEKYNDDDEYEEFDQNLLNQPGLLFE